jgi:alpha-galactosidase/6-phospho-beta-glucosidase family protein
MGLNHTVYYNSLYINIMGLNHTVYYNSLYINIMGAKSYCLLQ